MSLSIHKLQNLIRAQIIALLSSFSHLRCGIVTSYDETTYRARVKIMPEETLTEYLPISTEWVGNGWGMYAPPSINDLVLIDFLEGDFSCGVIIKRLFNAAEVPIVGVPSGEFWLFHQTGSYFKLKNDGTVEIHCVDADGNPTNVNILANLQVQGSITATGDILDSTGLSNTDTVRGMRGIYNSHTHSGVQPGGGDTGPPNHDE